MKRFLSILLSLLIVFTLVGCNVDPDVIPDNNRYDNGIIDGADTDDNRTYNNNRVNNNNGLTNPGTGNRNDLIRGTGTRGVQ